MHSFRACAQKPFSMLRILLARPAARQNEVSSSRNVSYSHAVMAGQILIGRNCTRAFGSRDFSFIQYSYVNEHTAKGLYPSTDFELGARGDETDAHQNKYSSVDTRGPRFQEQPFVDNLLTKKAPVWRGYSVETGYGCRIPRPTARVNTKRAYAREYRLHRLRPIFLILD